MAETTHRIRAVAPSLLVTDLKRAAAYYAECLGFVSPRLWGDPAIFCISQRDGIMLMLSQVADPAYKPLGTYSDKMDAYFWIDDADALHEEMRANGAEIVFPPTDEQTYGQREFAVRDPDGHVLIFAQPIG